MNITENINRIKDGKQSIRIAINNKGGNLTESQLIGEYADVINNLASSVNLEFGYIDEQGSFQPLDLSSDTPVDTGEAKTVSLKMFNTGVEAPQAPSTSSMDFFKCASVDTANKSWSGYKAVLTDGVYTFEESITAGLTYSDITPATGKIYSADALIGVSWLYDGTDPSLVFYAPFSENKATAETGQALNVSGNPVYGEINGIPCVTFDGGSGYTTPGIDVSQFVDGFTFSCFAKPADRGSHTMVFGRRNGTYSCQYIFKLGIQEIACWAANSDETANVSKSDLPEINKMTHAAWRYKDGKFDFFIGGELVASGNGTIGNPDSGDTQIAATFYSGENYVGSLAALRLYSRALTDDEIKQLANEFTPTA